MKNFFLLFWIFISEHSEQRIVFKCKIKSLWIITFTFETWNTMQWSILFADRFEENLQVWLSETFARKES